MTAEVTHKGVFDMQVCVPKAWSDTQVIDFACKANPCGTTGGWFIRQEGSKYLDGAHERVPCEDKGGHVHIMLDA